VSQNYIKIKIDINLVFPPILNIEINTQQRYPNTQLQHKHIFPFSLALWGTGLLSQFHDYFTDGRTPWTSDQPVARPLPEHRTTQTQTKPTNLVSELRKTVHALDRSATVTGNIGIYICTNL
jgi:hypothetical protein